MTTRLIETWLPIAALGEEGLRERRPMTALPPTYHLHVWWARRPLVASRAAILAALLPADADRERFMHVLGIHGDPVATERRIGRQAPASASKLTPTATPGPSSICRAPRIWNGCVTKGPEWVWSHPSLDPTAGGGSIPFEAARLGLATFANDLNPVAVRF